MSGIKELLGRDPSISEQKLIDVLQTNNELEAHFKELNCDNIDNQVEDNKKISIPGLIEVGNGVQVAVSTGGSGKKKIASTLSNSIHELLSYGCKPIAYLESLRTSESRESLAKMISEVGGFCNRLGIPNIGGDVEFSDLYDQFSYMSSLIVGLIREKDAKSLVSGDPGDILLHYGFEKDRTVNPINEKMLIDTTVKLRDMELASCLQSISNNGILTSIYIIAKRAKCGFYINLSDIISSMDDFDELIRENHSCGMIAAISPKNIKRAEQVISKIGIHYRILGRLMEEKQAVIGMNEQIEVFIPMELGNNDGEIKSMKETPLSIVLKQSEYSPPIEHPLLSLLASANLSNRKGIYMQYDQQVLGNTVIGPGTDAGVIKIPKQLLALSSGANTYMMSCDHFTGSVLSVLAEIRNVVARGAEPLGLVFNIATPTLDSLSYSKMKASVNAVHEVSKAFNIPIVSSNVIDLGDDGNFSFTAGIVGTIENQKRLIEPKLLAKESKIYLIGTEDGFLHGSEFHRQFGGETQPMRFDLNDELRVADLIRSSTEYVFSITDIGKGGLLVSLAKWAMKSDVGVEIVYETDDLTFLYGEFGERYLVQVNPEYESKFLRQVAEREIELTIFARVKKDKEFRLDKAVAWPLEFLREIWDEQINLIVSR